MADNDTLTTPAKKRQTRSYQAELAALQNRVDLAVTLLRGFVADPKKGPMRVEIALETLTGAANGAASS